jgi:hypothetical protein
MNSPSDHVRRKDVVVCVVSWFVALMVWPVAALLDHALSRPVLDVHLGSFAFSSIFDLGTALFVVLTAFAAALTAASILARALRPRGWPLWARALLIGAGFVVLAVVGWFLAIFAGFFFISSWLGG